MYRRQPAFWQIFTAEQEVVIALDTKTGETRWQFAYEAPFKSEQGSRPYAMPQIVGDLLLSVGATGKLHALKAQTGELVWSRNLYQEFEGTRLQFGYSSHPLPYGNVLVVAVGGKSKAVAAIDQNSGRTVWAGLSFNNAHSSPIVIQVDGRDPGCCSRR